MPIQTLTIPVYPIKFFPASPTRIRPYIVCIVQFPVVQCYAMLYGIVPCAIVRLCCSVHLLKAVLQCTPALNQTRAPTMRFLYFQSMTSMLDIPRIPKPKYPQQENVAAAVTATPLHRVTVM